MINDNLTNVETKELIRTYFAIFKKRKENGTLYQKHDKFPGDIIKLYYTELDRDDIKNIYEVFKEKYLVIERTGIARENKFENVHSKEEKRGLYEVYTAIQNDTISVSKLGIYSLNMLQQKLFSKTPHPEFAGGFRCEPARLSGSPIELSAHENIAKEINSLNDSFQRLVTDGISIRKQFNYNKILNYIKNCVRLHCRLIKIHPFRDGNGRTTRALMNALFKIVGIPPVYIHPLEKNEYFKAMEKAIVHGEYQDIITFFQYKICESIIALDSSMQNKEQKNCVKLKH